MKTSHFEHLKPLCPRCLRDLNLKNRLELRAILEEQGQSVIQGLLVCSATECQSEYPIIDGIPILVPDVRDYVSRQILSICGRTDLSPVLESLVGDCCGPGSAFELIRQYAASYVFDHYGDLDPAEPADQTPRPGALKHLVASGLEAAADVHGPVVDLGCAVGRSSFELALAVDELVLGIDLDFSMLKKAAQVLNNGEIAYPRRKTGLVYDPRTFAVTPENAGQVDFWACDATALPFAEKKFGLAASFNLLDCVSSPYTLLQSMARILTPGGKGIVATPFDWSASATPVQSWIGGHSQRGETKGACEPALRSLLDGTHPHTLKGLRLIGERPSLPWTVRLHDRGFMQYDVYMAIVQAGAHPSQV